MYKIKANNYISSPLGKKNARMKLKPVKASLHVKT